MLKTINVNYDIIEGIKSELKEMEKKEAPFHAHVYGKRGASGLGNCNFIDAWKEARLPVPKPIGLKADTGAMTVGKIWHNWIEDLCISNYNKSIFKKQNPNLFLCKEVYIETKLTEDITTLTPIDLAFIETPNEKILPTIEENVDFQTKTSKVKVKHHDGKFVKIYDIKTADNKMAYWKYKDEGLSYGYVAQMHNNMVGSGLKQCDVLFVNKGNLQMFVIPCEYDDQVWQTVIEKNQRKHDIANKLKDNRYFDISDEDFTYLSQEDDYECVYCPLSQTEELMLGVPQRETLVLKAPCVFAQKRVRELIGTKFGVNTTWKRGSSHVTILKNENDLIVSKNKSGTEFVDTIFYAYKNFQPMETKIN